MIGRLGRIHPLRSWLYSFTNREAEDAMDALDRVGMAGFAARLTGSLSGGECSGSRSPARSTSVRCAKQFVALALFF